MGSDEDTRNPADERETAIGRKRTQVTGGVIVAVAAVAWFAFGKQFVSQRRFKNMETYVLKADNGTEAHIRPLGCCIQSAIMLADPTLFAACPACDC